MNSKSEYRYRLLSFAIAKGLLKKGSPGINNLTLRELEELIWTSYPRLEEMNIFSRNDINIGNYKFTQGLVS